MLKPVSTDWASNKDIKQNEITTNFPTVRTVPVIYWIIAVRILPLILHYLKIHYTIEIRPDHINFSWITKCIATHSITTGIDHVTQN